MAFTLSFGAFFVARQVEAWSLLNFFGDQASASVGVTDSSLADGNSQTMALLQATVTSASKDSTADTAANSASSAGVDDSGSALVPNVGSGSPDDAGTSDQVSVYVVRSGDSISQIANMFGVSVNTILWANDMKKGDPLTPGDVLFILPVSGVEHTVTKGQTLQSIAKLYRADPADIAEYNGVAVDAPLAVGDQLIIPDGEKSEESDKPVQDLGASIAKDTAYYLSHPSFKNIIGYFIDPVPGYRLSQGIHDDNAVDLAIARGTPIHAAASGVVALARVGYNGGFGNLVIIDHPNGTQTLYAHQSKLATRTGDAVTQGEVIGYVGTTGHSTGPHLHFEVHGARNPGADDSWAQ